jgi:ATP-dependent Clp protease ATP-binding subunit ClpA
VSQIPQPTLGFQRVIQRAILHVQSSGKKEVTGANVLVAIFGEKDSHAVYFLHQQGVTPSRRGQLHLARHQQGAADAAAGQGRRRGRDRTGAAGRRGARTAYTVNLNQLALQGKIDPLIGRDREVERVIQTLCRRRKNNPLLVGEAGVGKTAIAEGLARRIVEGDVPDILRQVAGLFARHGRAARRHQVSRRLRAAPEGGAQAAARQPDAILFIDEIHTLIGAGAASGGTLDASNLLKPALAQGQLKCIGATTYAEYRGVFEKDHALSRRFQKIDVTEPSVSETVEILRGLKSASSPTTASSTRRRAELGGRTVGPLHQRPPPARQGDRRHRRGRRAQRILPKSKQKQGDRQARDRGHRRQDRAHPAAQRVVGRPDALKNLDRDLKATCSARTRPSMRWPSAIKMARSGLGNPGEADRLLPVQPARPASARPRSPAARVH